MDEAKLKRVLSGMVDLLVAYEIELTAFRTVFGMVENEARKAGMPFNITNAVNGLITSPSIRIGAEQRYTKLLQIQKAVTPESLDLALAGIRDIIAHRTGQPPPG
jgi:hypothetical protein